MSRRFRAKSVRWQSGPDQTLVLTALMVDDWSQVIPHDVMRIYRAKRDEAHSSVNSKYTILGFISSGTYGRVYKAQSKDEEGRLHAIKKFKPDKDGDIATYTGISQSAIREIAVGDFDVCLAVSPMRNSLTGRSPMKTLSLSKKSYWRTSRSTWYSSTRSMTSSSVFTQDLMNEVG